jgi:hypothetical protein
MKFGDILSKFDKDLQLFNERALLCDRRETKEFQSLQIRFMKHQLVETQKNFSGILSMGQAMIETINRGQLEGAQNGMQRQTKGAQAKIEKEYRERGILFILRCSRGVVLTRM